MGHTAQRLLWASLAAVPALAPAAAAPFACRSPFHRARQYPTLCVRPQWERRVRRDFRQTVDFT